jgi:hypothetical protein
MFRKYNGFVSKARVSTCMYFLVFYQINPFSVPTMEKILKSCCDYFFVRFLQNPDFASNELIFMLEPADI